MIQNARKEEERKTNFIEERCSITNHTFLPQKKEVKPEIADESKVDEEDEPESDKVS